jgi:uncharacterized protein YjlB
MTPTHRSTMPSEAGQPIPVTVATYRFADDGLIPNHPTLPLVLYPGVLPMPATAPAAAAERLLWRHGWGDTWRNGIYRFHHYHSTAHEVLLICRGRARVQFGGEAGVIVTVQAGDGVVIPAGVGHNNLSDSGDLLGSGRICVGARLGSVHGCCRILNTCHCQPPIPSMGKQGHSICIGFPSRANVSPPIPVENLPHIIEKII